MLRVIKKRVTTISDRKLIIVVSSKVSKKATERNLIRRRIKNIIHPFTKECSSFKYTIIAEPGIMKKSFKEIKGELEKRLVS